MAEQHTIIWISGASEGIGRGIANMVPYPNARIISLSRRVHPELETVQFDLTKPDTWKYVGESFERELANFAGKRAIFIHNAIYRTTGAYVADPDTDMGRYYDEMIANGVAPHFLGDMFLRAVRPGYESGLAMITSSCAVNPYEGGSSYCSSKASVEMWVRVVRRELKTRNRDSWVVAIRPGFVDTPNTRFKATLSAHDYPAGEQIAKQLASGEGMLTEDEAGRGIWSMLPPKEDDEILHQGSRIIVPMTDDVQGIGSAR